MFRDRSVPVTDEIGEHVEGPGPNRHRFPFAPKLEALQVDLEIVEGIHRHGALQGRALVREESYTSMYLAHENPS